MNTEEITRQYQAILDAKRQAGLAKKRKIQRQRAVRKQLKAQGLVDEKHERKREVRRKRREVGKEVDRLIASAVSQMGQAS